MSNRIVRFTSIHLHVTYFSKSADNLVGTRDFVASARNLHEAERIVTQKWLGMGNSDIEEGSVYARPVIYYEEYADGSSRHVDACPEAYEHLFRGCF